MNATGEGPARSSSADPETHATTDSNRPASAVAEVCPYLRDASGAWRSAHASREHRCAAVEPPVALAVAKQRSLCLVAAHGTCATYLAARAANEVGRPDRAGTSADLWPDTRSAPILLEPTRGIVPLPGGAVRTGGQALLVGLMVLAFLVLVVARTTAPPASGSPSGNPSPGNPSPVASTSGVGGAASPSAPVAVTPSPAPTTTATPTASPVVSPSTSPAATTGPSPVSTSTPAARRYTVKSGDTLSRIAATYGITVKAIKAANGLTGNVIRPGQVLVIP